MKPGFRFVGDGVVYEEPRKRTLTSGKVVHSLVIECAGSNGRSPDYYRVNINSCPEAMSLKRGARVRVEGVIGSRLGEKAIFLDLYGDAVLMHAGEPPRISTAPGSGRVAPPPSGSDPAELGYGRRKSSASSVDNQPPLPF